MVGERPSDIQLPEGWTWERVEEQRAKWGIDPSMVPVALVPGAAVAWGTINSVRVANRINEERAAEANAEGKLGFIAERAAEVSRTPLPAAHNVDDRRRGWVGSWETEPLKYESLGPDDQGRTVIYQDHGRAEGWRHFVVARRHRLRALQPRRHRSRCEGERFGLRRPSAGWTWSRMKPVTLTVLDWHGELPMIGQYLKSARGRTAYLILDIRRAAPGAKHVARLRCERHNPLKLPKGAVVWGWRWSKR